jgi:4-amino-4-deoxy-L-arabinose transferase-like glycosyltransferase
VIYLVLAAGLLRLALVQFRNLGFPRGWGGEMTAIATALAQGRGFADVYGEPTGPTALCPPAYPWLLSLIFRGLGPTVDAGMVALYLNVLFSAAATLIVFRLGDELFERRAGVLAAALWAFWPLVGHTEARYLWNTSLYVLLATTVVGWTLSMRRGSAREWTAFWILAGITVLVDSSALVLLFVCALWVSIFRERRPRRWLLAALVVSSLLAPSLVRNQLVLGRFVLRSNLGLELARGISDRDFELTDFHSSLPNRDPAEMRRFREVGEIAYMDEKFQAVRQYVAAHPGAYLRLAARRFVAFWAGNTSLDYLYWPARRFLPLKHALYLLPALCALGGVIELRRSPARWLMCGLLGLIPLVYYFTIDPIRYRAPIEPLIAALAAGFLSASWSRACDSLANRSRARE